MASEAAASSAAAAASMPPEGPKPTTKGRGKRLTDAQRMEIIARLEDKAAPISRAKCARLYGVTPAAISKLMKVSQLVKKRYMDAGADAGNARDKRQRGGFVKNVGFEDELYQWVCSVRARNIPLLVAHVQQKAKLLAHRHSLGDGFKASNGWYYRFCARYGLTPATLHAGGGRSSHVDMSMPVSASPAASRTRASDLSSSAIGTSNNDVKVFPKSSEAEFAKSLGELQEQVASFGPEFVYNLSETRLFYQLLPSSIGPPLAPADLAASGAASSASTATTENSPNGIISKRGVSASSSSNASASSSDAVGKIERVLLLVCTNGTGTHKIPLLVVGKDPAPPSLQALNSLRLVGGGGNGAGPNKPLNMSTQYYSQREVWCDRRTFAYWCEHVFLPAIRQRTARPVLLLVENPGGHLEKFLQENVVTTFIPSRAQGGGTASGGAVNNNNADSSLSSHPAVRMQPMQCGVIRDLKRRFRIALFQAMLTFLERPEDERFRLRQRAMKKSSGCAGITFGRPPHLHDAIRVLDSAWNAIPADMVRECWIKSELTRPPETPKAASASFELEISDELVVLELCSMLRNVTLVEDMNALARELRQWLSSDDDSSERMQQELLHDIQKLLQEEEQINGAASLHNSQQLQQQQQQQQQGQPLHAAQDMMSLNMSAAQRLVAAGIDPAAAAAAMGFDPQFLYRSDMSIQARQGQPINPAGPVGVDMGLLLREKQKAVAYALRSLAAAEEALDNPFVAEFFGEPTAAAAMETVSHVLRELRRVQRGKQSTLMAATSSAASGPSQSDDATATTAHEYFYGAAP